MPLVTIGIPAYNRALLLKRSIESALNQDYTNIEVIVSDNASTDDTENICRHFCINDERFKYIRHETNRGAKANFIEVLDNASGQYFMWLGDDDWIDPDYIGSCIKQLFTDPTIVLVSGSPYYYLSGKKCYEGKVFSLLHDIWWHRIVVYYKKVCDNGMFYGLMPTDIIRNIDMPQTMGGDWILLANIVAIGKVKMLSETSVHRELGGMSASYQNIARINGLPKVQALFPHIYTACSAYNEIMTNKRMYKTLNMYTRFFVAGTVFFLVVSKRPIAHFINASKRIKNLFNLN
jgi:glycosyltransferase involved in cell wall biosynthesis